MISSGRQSGSATGRAVESGDAVAQALPRRSATVPRVSRPALRLGAACLLLLAGAASSLAATRSHAVHGSTTTATTATTVTSPAKVVLAMSGHGWGHGLGMGQWGAYGYAKHGWTYEQILAHYYLGTTLGPAPVSAVRVLLAQSKKATIEVIDRQTGKILSTVGNGAGAFPGQFEQAHGIAVDSKGNIYVAENRGKRIQRFKVVSR